MRARGLPIMKLSTLRDRVEASCPRCHHGLPTRCGTNSPRCSRPARCSSPPIRGAVTAAGSATGSCSTSWCRYCGSAAPTTRSPTPPARRRPCGPGRDEWIALGVFAALARIAREAYDRLVGLALDHLAVDGYITKAPGGGECAGPSPVDRRKQGLKRSVLVEGGGIPPGRVLAGAHRHDSPLLEPTLDRLAGPGPLPQPGTGPPHARYHPGKTRTP